MSPGSAAAVRVRLLNTGTTTWTAGTLYRLGALSGGSFNQVTWSGFSCGGYMNGPLDGRAFLCHSVSPGGTHDLNFEITVPPGATGSVRFAVRMVRDGIEWFGQSYAWTIAVSDSPSLPDVIVDSVALSPPDPIVGEQMSFTSVVRNIGSAPTPSGVVIGVGYRVDGGQVTWGAVQGPLAPGASVTVGTQGGTWKATPGDHTLTAVVDDVNRFSESNETNNTRSVPFEVQSSPEVANLYAMNIDPANPKGRPSAQQLKAIGVRWLRVEWKITHGFAFYDPILSEHRAAGLKVLLLLDYSTVPNKPASTASDAQWVAYRSRFLEGVEQLASHYGDAVDAWQIWNEPDLFQPGTGYDPGVPAHHYGLMLRDATRAIRLYSSRPIVSGGLTTANPSYLDAARQSAGVLNVDAIAIHPYGRRAPDDWPHASLGFGNMSELFERFLIFDLPLWVTEIGTIGQPIQAQYLENVYRLVMEEYLDRVPVAFWFCWSDGMVSPHGIVDWDGNPKPSYHRYQNIAPPWETP
jgi:hypothetical protein